MDACIKECSARRQRCKSVNYKRLYNVCELCTDINEAALITDVGTATVLLDDDSLELVSVKKKKKKKKNI